MYLQLMKPSLTLPLRTIMHIQISGFDVVRRDRQLHGRNGGKSTWLEKRVNSFVYKRQFKYFNENEFLSELSKIDWNETCASGDPNVMWYKWLLNFATSLILRDWLQLDEIDKLVATC